MNFPLPASFPARELILRFFWSFATFECAMKRAGPCKAGRHRTAEPNWQAFEEGIRETALGSESFKVAAKALKDYATNDDSKEKKMLGKCGRREETAEPYS